MLAPRLPVDVPVPVRVGLPSADLPVDVEHRAVVRRRRRSPHPGRRAGPPGRRTSRTSSSRCTARLPTTPRSTRSAASRSPRASPRCASASTPLALPDGDRILERWRELAGAPDWDGPALWLHGDPHPANLLVHDGELRAVIDFGDVTSGDPASDLSTAWLTFDAEGRAAFRDRLTYDDATWRRAQAWALHLAVMLQMHPVDHPTLAEIGRHGVLQALADD